MESIKFNIPNPCHEDWDKMSPKDQGRHCNACQKIVVDFTNMSDHEIFKYIKTHSNQRICGRSKTSQLNRKMSFKKDNPIFYKAALVAISISFIPIPILSQTEISNIEAIAKFPKKKFIISGVINEDDGTPAISANVVFSKNGAFIIGVATDFDGRFNLELEGETLSEFEMKISYLGFKEKIIYLQDHASSIHEIQVNLHEKNDIFSPNMVVSGNIIPVIQNDNKLSKSQNIQKRYKITGIVTEPNGDPAISANISLFQNGQFIKGVACGFDGKYQFENIEKGNYEIKASYVGFPDKNIPNIQISQDTQIDVTLEEGAITGDIIVVQESYLKRLWRKVKK